MARSILLSTSAALALGQPREARADLEALGDSTYRDSKKRSEWLVLPFALYTPETSVAFSLAFVGVFRDAEHPDARPSNIRAAAAYTLKSQFIVATLTQLFFDGEEWQLTLEGYAKLFPDRFYGLGNDHAKDAYESYTRESYNAPIAFMRRVWSKLYVGPTYELRWARILDKEPGGQLARGSIPGSGDNGLLGGGVQSAWDTRDNVFAPASGAFHQASFVLYPDVFRYGFYGVRAEIDVRDFRRIHSDNVLATRAYASVGEGVLPFTALPYLGSDSRLRGIHAARYQDMNAFMVMAELRSAHVWRFGGVVFAGAGRVARRLSELDLAGIRLAGGVGLRFAVFPKERLDLRADVGVGPSGEVEAYFNAGEAF